jgi:nitrate/nitrite transporter NarK
VRLRIDETPVFVAEQARNPVPSAPIAELLRLRRREILLAAGSIVGGFGFVYMANTYLTIYAHSHLGYTRSFIWSIGVLGGLAAIVVIALSGDLSDRFGRRRVMLVGWASCVPWALAVIPLMDSRQPVLYGVAIVGMFAISGVGSGPTGALIPELFATRYRYTGSALAVNLAGIVGGAVPPLIAGTLQATYGSWAVGPMLAILASAGLVCTYLLPETMGTALHSADSEPEVSASG